MKFKTSTLNNSIQKAFAPKNGSGNILQELKHKREENKKKERFQVLKIVAIAVLVVLGIIFFVWLMLSSASSKYRKAAETAHKEYDAAHKKWQEAVKNVEKQQLKLDQAKEEEAQAKTLGDRLEWLAGRQELSNEEMEEAEQLIALLTERYGKLNIKLDKTHNKILIGSNIEGEEK